MPVLRREFVAFTLLAGCARRRRSILVSAQPFMTMCGLHLAQERGYFPLEGVDVEIRDGMNSVQSNTLLAGGSVDVVFAALNPSLVNAVARGAPIRIVAGREIVNPACGEAGFLYARRAAFPGGLRDLKELKGKRVSYTGRSSITEFCLDTLLESAGLDTGGVEVVILPRNDAAAALVAGRIDAMVGFDFAHARAFETPDILRRRALSEILPGFQYTFVCFGRELLRDNPERGARFLRAYLRGTREFVAGATPAYMEKVARAFGQDLEAVRKECRSTVAVDGSVDYASLQRFVAWAVRKGYCPRAVQAAEMVDPRFLARRAEG